MSRDYIYKLIIQINTDRREEIRYGFNKEVLKKVLSDDFIKECAEDFTKDGIEQLTGTMLGAVTKTFFENGIIAEHLHRQRKKVLVRIRNS